MVKFSIPHSSYIVECDNYLIRSAFQAIISSENEVIGYEALSRIQCRDTGQSIRPDIFFKALVNLCNHREVLFEINRCHLMTFRLSEFYTPDRKIFLNLTPDFFIRLRENSEILNVIKGILDDLDISSFNVVAEITEMYACNESYLSQGVELISSSSFMTAIDDFGDEMSNISRCIACKPDIVKISRNLYLENIERKPKYLMELVHYFQSNKAKVVVEGIEDESHVEILKRMGVDYFQGFLFHKPELVEFEESKYVN